MIVDSSKSLKQHLIIATPSLRDPTFTQSVVYLCEHDQNGATGFMINKPSDITLAQILPQIQLDIPNQAVANHPILIGGPVNPHQGFILCKGDADERTQAKLHLDGAKKVLKDYATPERHNQLLLAIGHASWGSGQLEEEIARNDWLAVPSQKLLLFDVPLEQRWEAAFNLIGCDPYAFSAEVGHA